MPGHRLLFEIPSCKQPAILHHLPHSLRHFHPLPRARAPPEWIAGGIIKGLWCRSNAAMTILGPTRYPRLNEGIGFVYLALGIAIVLSLVSYHPPDISWNSVGAAGGKPLNLIGKAGAHAADILLQLAGLGAFTVPVLLFALAWKWLRSEPIGAQLIKLIGSAALVLGACTA